MELLSNKNAVTTREMSVARHSAHRPAESLQSPVLGAAVLHHSQISCTNPSGASSTTEKKPWNSLLNCVLLKQQLLLQENTK